MARLLLWVCCLMGMMPAWGRAAQPETYQVLASIRPIALLVQELAGDLPIQVDTLLPAGATTHDYALAPSDLSRIKHADRVLWLGPGSEPYLRKVLQDHPRQLAWAELPDLLKLPARDALHGHTGDDEHELGHEDDDHEHEHHHHGSDGLDPHIWWSVPNAILLARALEARIASDRPAWQARLQHNREQLEKTLQSRLVKQRARLATGFKPFLLAHDAFFYLEEDLGIQSDAAIMLDPESKPGLKHLMALKQRVQEQNIGCVLTGALVPANLIDKIDTDPPLLRQPMDELGWDYRGTRYSEWLELAYRKVAECVGLSPN